MMEVRGQSHMVRIIIAISLSAWVGLFTISPALAHEGDHNVVQEITHAYKGPRVGPGAPGAHAAAEAIVALAVRAHDDRGKFLLPKGTAVDSATWAGGVLHVRLTVPAVTPGWHLTPVDAESLTAVMHLPFIGDPMFAGTVIRARREGGGYGTLLEFGPPSLTDTTGAALPPPPREPTRIPSPDSRGQDGRMIGQSDDSSGGPDTRGGPVGNAMRQPVGALTGVTVYVSAGHGWTAGASAWFLQRPVLLGMCEDYGNIDVINQFAAFAFNAGATVVPLRPVGWQPIEILLDNDDPNVTYTGVWTDSTTADKYFENGATNSGVPYRFATAGLSESATVRYSPAVSVSGEYPVYTFVVASTNRVRQLYRIAHAGGLSEVVVDHRNVGNGWVWLGSYFFAAGGGGYVEISNASPDGGVVIADGIRFGGGDGSTVRPGPGSVSGYPQDEEAQRYWGESQLGALAVGFDPTIWDQPSVDDQSDNVGAGARIAREMNQVPAGGVGVERWKRIHLEFHSNASTGAARGQLCLITDLGATTNQSSYATILSNEIDADMNLLSSQGLLEHPWVDRASATLTGSYGAIATTNNSNEFDATLVELAFHDNEADAELLRDSRVRAFMARACVHGIIRFLNTNSGGQVPLAFAPDTPREFAVRDMGGGNVQLSWTAPQVDGAHGDAATGYVVYQSSDGIAFGDPIVLGNVTSTTIPGVPVEQTRYFRIAATGAGGESMPSEVLAVRRPGSGTANVLIVSGFDRLRRSQNLIQTFTQPAAYAGLSIERQIWRVSNAYDYVIEHGDALAANGLGFSSGTNEAVASGAVALAGYTIVDWLLGVESAEDRTFSASEQTRVQAYLDGGGKLFVSGADLAYDLVNQGGGASFAQNYLHVGYSLNDANSYSVTPTGNGLFGGIGPFNFDPLAGAAYDVREPDALTAGTNAASCLTYSTGGVAGVQYSSGVFNVVALGFPFEAISDGGMRALVMQRVIQFLTTAGGPLEFDFDNDGDVDFADFNVFTFCLRGPGFNYGSTHICREFDGNGDTDVDLGDFAEFQRAFTGPP